VTSRWFRNTLFALPLALLATLHSPSAHALSIQSLFDDLCQYQILDSDTCAAKTVLECLKSGGGSISAMQKCAADYDPKAKKFIDIYVAATKPDLVKFIELAGPIVACQAATSVLPPGKPKDIICSKALMPIVEKSFGKAAQIYQAAASGDWLKIIYLVGDLQLACDLVPSFPGKDITCGAVAQILNEGGKLLKQGAAAGVDALENGVESLGGLAVSGLQSLGLGKAGVAPETTFYHLHAKPWLHQRTLLGLTKQNLPSYDSPFGKFSSTPPGFLGFDFKLMEQCINFTYGGSQQKYAEAVCKNKSQQLHNEASALAKLVAVAPSSYFENVKATAALLVATNYWSGADKFLTAFKQIPPKQWSAEGFQTLPTPFSALLANCVANTKSSFPVPLAPTVTGLLTPPNMWGWVCHEVGTKLVLAMVQEKTRLATQVIPVLNAAGCVVAKNTDGTLKFDCNNYTALAMCHTMFESVSPHSRCHADAQANQKLAHSIVNQLGKKRCQVADDDVACTRPWKVDACKSLLAKQQQLAGVPTGVKCNPPPMTAQIAFAALVSQTQNIVYTLNGGVKKSAGAKTDKGGKTGQGEKFVQVLPISDNCKTMWDPLAITCKNPDALAALQGVTLGYCPGDPNKDGADSPCYGGPLSKAAADKAAAKAGLGTAGVGGFVPKTESARKPVSGFKPGDHSGAVKPVTPFIPSDDKHESRVATATPSRALLQATARPKITISGVQTKIEPNCQSPRPAFTAAITIANTGGPLPASKGTVYLKEIGGANLYSAGIQLLAIGAGQVQVVHVAATTLSPYSALPGSHQIGVHLNPLVEAGGASFDVSTVPYLFGVNFPAGHCDSRVTQPAPARQLPAPAAPTRR
jgi:hypothetical protein